MAIEAKLLAARFSKEELETQLDAALQEMTGGKTIIQWSVGDSSAQKQPWLNAPPGSRAKVIAEALSILDPVTYPPEDFIAITQTRPTFS